MFGFTRKEVMIFSIILGLVVAGVLGIVWLPKREIGVLVGPFLPQQQFEMLDKSRGTWAQVIGGIFLALGVIATWYRALAADKSAQAALDTAKAAERSASAALESVRAAQEGQITERFTRAIEQLGSEKLEVRLGGIYALERIARDSEKDHWTIMEVLTAYVRENARWGTDKALDWEEMTEEQRRDIQPRTDIQAIMTVIGRRARTYGKGEDQRLNLAGVDLRQTKLMGAHLEGAALDASHLEGAWLRGAHLDDALLWGAMMKRARLPEAHLRGAQLQGADLQSAHLRNADLADADLHGTILRRVDLRTVSGLTQAQIHSATIDEITLLPDKVPGMPPRA